MISHNKIFAMIAANATENTPSSLIELCMEVLLREKGVDGIEKVLEIYDKVDLRLNKVNKLREHIMKKLHIFFPLLLHRYDEEDLKVLFHEEDWQILYNAYQNTEEAKERFASLKGCVLERKMVHYDESSEFYPLEVLVQGVIWPAKVNPSHREAFLSDHDFECVFGLSKTAFYKLPKHIQERKKKEKSLF
eukprot:gene11297-12603_t